MDSVDDRFAAVLNLVNLFDVILGYKLFNNDLKKIISRASERHYWTGSV